MECVGCADRSAYDLTCHTKAAKTALVAKKDLKTPISFQKFKNIFLLFFLSSLTFVQHVTKDVVEALPDKGIIGKTFKKDGKAIMSALADLTETEITEMEQTFSKDE